MLVLVTGLPGSGKSYFAQKLAMRINAMYLNSDNIRMRLHARGKYSYDDKLIVYKEMAEQTAALLKNGRTVVADATFYRESFRTMFIELARQLGARIYVIEVRADDATIRKRLSTARDLSEADFRVYQKVKAQFEQIRDSHLVLTSTDNNSGEMLK